MKLLVTGGLGFIGSNFIHYWSARHPRDEILNLDKVTYAADRSNLDGLRTSRYTFVKGDIADGHMAGGLVRDTDMVVNFAAESHVDRAIADPAPFIHSNIVGVHVLLEAAKRYGKRFHQISTDEVYGSLAPNSKARFNEGSPYAPRNPYSATKAAADHLVRAYFNTYKMDVTISNCSNNFGPRQHREKLIPKAVLNGLANRSIPIYGDGMQVRDWIYVDDHCSAIELILRRGVSGETYLISSNGERRNIDVARYILRMLGRPGSLIRHTKNRPGHDQRYALDASKIRGELDWRPAYTFELGMGKTIEWYRARMHKRY